MTASNKQIDLKEIGLSSSVLITLIAVFLWKFSFFGQTILAADIINVRYPWSAYFLSLNQTIQVHNGLLADSPMVYYPYAHFLYSNLRQGPIPLWNPYIYAGLPFDPISWLAAPADIPFLFMSTPLAFAYSAALGLFLAGIFMYLLMRTMGAGALGSLVGSIVFMFNTNTVAWLSFPAHLSTELWTPLVFLLFFKTLSQRRTALAILTGGILGLQILSGYQQITLYLLIALTVPVLWSVVVDYRRSKRLSRLGKPIFLFLIVVLVALLIAAATVIPLKENIDLSIRIFEGRTAGQGYPLPYLITFLIPNFFGNPADQNFWGAWGNYTESIKYVGILPLILTGVAVVFRKARRETRGYRDIFLCITFLTILISMGSSSPLYPLLSLFPYFYTSSVIRILALLAFTLSVLSGLGADLLDKETGERFLNGLSRYAKTAFFGVPCIVMCLVLLVLLGSGKIVEGLASGFGSSFQSLINYEITNVALLFVWIALSFLLFLLITHRKLRGRLLAISLVLLIVLDLFAAGITYNTFVNPTTVYPVTKSIDFLKQDHSLYRILPIGVLSTFIPDSTMVYEIPTVTGYDPLVTERYWEYASLIDGTLITANGVISFSKFTKSKLVDLLNVKYVVTSPTYDPTLAVDLAQDQSDISVGEIWGNNTYGQTFIAHHQNLTAISIMLATYRRANSYNSICHLKESPNSKTDLVTIPFNNSQVQDNEYYTFRFRPIADSENKSYYFYLESSESHPGNAITIWSSSTDAYAEGQKYVNGALSQGDLRFKTYYDTSTHLALVYDGEVKIYENLDYLPRAFVVQQAKVIRDKDQILKELRSERFDPSRYVILEDAAPDELVSMLPAGQPLSSGSLAQVIGYSPNRVLVRARMAASGFLVLADAYDSNWEVYVDGNPGRIHVADYVLRAVYLDKGDHSVEFVYNPQAFRILLYVSLSTLLGVAVVTILTIYRSRFEKSQRTHPGGSGAQWR